MSYGTAIILRGRVNFPYQSYYALIATSSINEEVVIERIGQIVKHKEVTIATPRDAYFDAESKDEFIKRIKKAYPGIAIRDETDPL